MWNAIRWNGFLGHDKVVDILLQNGAEYDEKDKDGNSPLYWAIWEGDWPFSIIWIVELSENLIIWNNFFPNHLETSIKLIANIWWINFSGHEKVADLLIEMSSSVKARNNFDNTPLHWAAWSGKFSNDFSKRLVKCDFKSID